MRRFTKALKQENIIIAIITAIIYIFILPFYIIKELAKEIWNIFR